MSVDRKETFAAFEATEAIRQLKARYAERCDDGYDPDGVSALFTEGATWERPDAGILHRGRQAIRAAMVENGRKYAWSSHMLGQPQIALAPGGLSATGRWPMFCLLAGKDHDSRLKFVVATYEDEFERVDRDWRIRRLIVRVRRTGELIQPVAGSDTNARKTGEGK